MIDLTFQASRDTTKDEINSALQKAADSKLARNIGYFHRTTGIH